MWSNAIVPALVARPLRASPEPLRARSLSVVWPVFDLGESPAVCVRVRSFYILSPQRTTADTSCMAQPVLCSGVGQGSDYVEAEPWGAAFLPRRPGVVLSIPIYPQRAPSTRVASEYPVRGISCTCKLRELLSFPCLPWTLATSEFAVAESVLLRHSASFLRHTACCCLSVHSTSPWSATIVTGFSRGATTQPGTDVLASLVLLPTWQPSLRATGEN